MKGSSNAVLLAGKLKMRRGQSGISRLQQKSKTFMTYFNMDKRPSQTGDFDKNNTPTDTTHDLFGGKTKRRLRPCSTSSKDIVNDILETRIDLNHTLDTRNLFERKMFRFFSTTWRENRNEIFILGVVFVKCFITCICRTTN